MHALAYQHIITYQSLKKYCGMISTFCLLKVKIALLLFIFIQSY
jgi:hypothetical protein